VVIFNPAHAGCCSKTFLVYLSILSSGPQKNSQLVILTGHNIFVINRFTHLFNEVWLPLGLDWYVDIGL